MKRILLEVAYDGTNYHGWQIQPNANTIESELNKALCHLTGEEIHVIGASRTDSGVHALCNLAVFNTASRIPAEKFSYALNQGLPEDIRIRNAREVEANFHPRKCHSIKTYRYSILNTAFAIPTQRHYSYFYHYPLNVELMVQGASYLEGEHDFIAFSNQRTQAESTIRTIYSIQIEKNQDTIELVVKGSGFLYNMVRLIAGTLIQVGRGYYQPEYVKEILEGCERGKAGPVAPAKGLTLVSYEFVQRM